MAFEATARFAINRPRSGIHRRPARRTLLASVAGTVLLSMFGVLAVSTRAGADDLGPVGGGYDRIGIRAFWFLPPSDRVSFKDIGGQCDRDKSYPSETVSQLLPKSSALYLYSAYAGGSCAFESSHAQYRVDVTEPSGKTLWTDINVTETSWSSRTYRVDCYGTNATLPCRSDSRFQHSSFGPTALFGTTTGPSGYTWCAPEDFSCSGLPGTLITVAYGADGHFVHRSEDVSRSGIYPCSTSQFFGQDPAHGFLKSCYYRKS